MKQQLDRYSAALQKLEAFWEKWGENHSCEFGLTPVIDFGMDVPRVIISVSSYPRAVGIAGEVFGKEGWMRDLNYDCTRFDWSREIDDVLVKLMGAQPNETPNRSPVSPREFPILLKEEAA